MKKLFAGFLAILMVITTASTLSLAAGTKPNVEIELDNFVVAPDFVGSDSAVYIFDHQDKMKLTTEIMEVALQFLDVNGKQIGEATIPVKESFTSDITVSYDTTYEWLYQNVGVDQYTDLVATVLTVAQAKKMLLGKTFSAVIDGKVYLGEIAKESSLGVVVQLDGAALDADTNVNVIPLYGVEVNVDGLRVQDRSYQEVEIPSGEIWAVDTYLFVGAVYTPGDTKETADVEMAGEFFENLSLSDVVLCDGNGNPLPMVEKASGVNKDLNDADGFQSNRSLYFMVNEDVVPGFADDKLWKIKTTKGKNAKLIKSIEDVTKIFDDSLVNPQNSKSITSIGFTKRHRFLKIKLNELYTDDEHKVTLDLRLSPTSKAVELYADQGVEGSEIKVKDFSFWVKNIVRSADNEWTVGTSGLMLDPVKNDLSKVTYTDEDGDVAFVKFFGDSNTEKFYAKLSTKWTHADYAAHFNNQDAYYFEFTGSPKMSSTSRADLQIYNPFTDEDGNKTIDPTTATIYQIVDGDLIDVTDSFTYGEGENGEEAFIARTRFIGSYIICEKPIQVTSLRG